MHQYGEDRTREAMANIAVSTRKWANMNEKAYFYDRPGDVRRLPRVTLDLLGRVPFVGLLLGDGCGCGDSCDDR